VGSGAEGGDGGGRQSAHPEERVDLAVLERVDGFGAAEPFACHGLFLAARRIRSRCMSLSLSRPAASMTRNAITSVALPGEPVETRLPLRSDIFSTPVPSMLTTCMRLG